MKLLVLTVWNLFDLDSFGLPLAPVGPLFTQTSLERQVPISFDLLGSPGSVVSAGNPPDRDQGIHYEPTFFLKQTTNAR